MKRIFLNLKRFDISPEYGGVNRLAPMREWGGAVIERTQHALKAYPQAEYTIFLPEAHILGAAMALKRHSPIKLGCQGVYRSDAAPGGNFGAFTTNRPASAAKQMGCESALIGHCEERADKAGVLYEGCVTGAAAANAVNRLLNREVLCAQAAGLSVLYCIGETAEEQPAWRDVLSAQLDTGLKSADMSRVVVAYEPVWSIGPGKTPADKQYIQMIAEFIKAQTGGLPVVYGGGLKRENAAMLASIGEIDGGLIALTRFTGEIGFYPDEYIAIVTEYLKGAAL